MLIAPSEVEDRFNSFEKKVITYLSNSTNILGTIVLSSALMSLVILINNYCNQNIKLWNTMGGFNLFPYINRTIENTLVLGTVIFLWKNVRRDLFYIISTLIMTITYCKFQIPKNESFVVIPLIVITCLFINTLSYLFLKRIRNRLIVQSDYLSFSLFFWILLSVVSYILVKTSVNSFLFLSFLKFQLLWFFITASFLQRGSKITDPLLALNPLNALRYAIWPSGSDTFFFEHPALLLVFLQVAF